MTPTLLPGPAPYALSGENTVTPAQSIDAAWRDSSASGMGNTNRSCARMPVEYPPCVNTPSGCSWFCRTYHQYLDLCCNMRGAHVCVDHVRAVVLVVVVARATLQAAADLRTDACTVAGLETGHVRAHARHLPDDLVPDDEREARGCAPAAGERVQVRAAYTAVGDRDLDVVGAERLGCEWRDGERGPCRRICVTESLLVKMSSSRCKASSPVIAYPLNSSSCWADILDGGLL